MTATTQTLPSAQSFFSSSATSAKFETPGTAVTGRITSDPQVQQQKDFTTGALKFWDDGNPMVQLQVILATDQRDPAIPDDDGSRAVYVKGQMQKAVGEAVRKAGAKYLEVGGTLTVTYTGNGEAKQRGMNAPKLYSASYTAPAAGDQAQFFGTDQPGAATQAAAATVAASDKPAAPAAQFTPEQLAAMKAAGVDVSQFGG